MSQTSASGALALISRPALTITESADDYDGLVKSLQQAINPHGFIEQMYVADIECNRLGDGTSASVQSRPHQYGFPSRIEEPAD